MSLPGILQQLNQNSPKQPNMLDGIKNLIDMAKATGDKDILVQQLAQNNPNMQKAVDYVKANGGDPKTACYELLRQRGIDPTAVEKMMGKG